MAHHLSNAPLHVFIPNEWWATIGLHCSAFYKHGVIDNIDQSSVLWRAYAQGGLLYMSVAQVFHNLMLCLNETDRIQKLVVDLIQGS